MMIHHHFSGYDSPKKNVSQASERKFQPEKVKKGKNLGIYHDLPIQNLGNKPKMMISGLIIVQDIPK